jgi:hypothetical protein
MQNNTLTWICCASRARRIPAAILSVFFAAALISSLAPASGQEARPAAPPTAPSSGKALVVVYRVYRFTGSASHDHLFLNGTYWAYLKNSEYAYMEVDPGTVVVTGTTATYTVDVFTVAAAAAHDATKKENERIHFDAEAGKTYYLKWTSGPMGTGVKVTMMDPEKGAKEASKLNLSEPVKQPDNTKKEDKK